MVPAGIFLIAMGIFFLLVAIEDWDWAMDWAMKFNWPLNKLIGREGFRSYYIICGLFFTGLGILCFII